MCLQKVYRLCIPYRIYIYICLYECLGMNMSEESAIFLCVVQNIESLFHSISRIKHFILQNIYSIQ